VILVMILIAQSISIVSGNAVTSSGHEITLGKGTFIPDPEDKALAKKIVEKNSKIKELEAMLESCRNMQQVTIKHWIEIEDKWEKGYDSLELKYLATQTWWYRWGETTIFCVVSAAAGALATWAITK